MKVRRRLVGWSQRRHFVLVAVAVLTLVVIGAGLGIGMMVKTPYGSGGGGLPPYDAVRNIIQEAVTAYLDSHSGALPITGKSIVLNIPKGNFYVIDMCSLVESVELLRSMPDGCVDTTYDNCDAGCLGCLNTAHYVWLVDSYGAVFSTCVDVKNNSAYNGCDGHKTDGYQGVWP